METKINNQKIFNFIPSLIMKLIVDNPLKDKDVFCELFSKKSSSNINSSNTKSISSFINPGIFPIINELPSSLIMVIKLGGFYKLISTLVLKDHKNQKEKLISEYLSIVTPRILLKISSIICENGGEIIKFNDFELTAIWINNNDKTTKYNLYTIYNKFNAKLALITAIELMKKVDKTEISQGVKLELSIGIGLGDVSCVFFGGERKRAEYVLHGEGINNAQLCLSYCVVHEIIIDKKINEIFVGGEEINTMDINEKKLFFSLLGYNEDVLKDFKIFKGLKSKNNKLCINKTFCENIENKMLIASSIIPYVLLKYLDLGIENNSQEINVITIETIIIQPANEIMNNLNEIQNIIFDIQKSIYLTFGILIHISKINKGFLIRCLWGINSSSFIDEIAKAISTASIICNLTKFYRIKIGIGISTGACFSGLISLQGNKKVYALLGKKVILSRLFAEEALKNVENNDKINYIIYCDKSTVKYSQRWYRHIFVSQLKVYLTKKNDDFEKYKLEFYYGKNNEKANKEIKFNKKKEFNKSNIIKNNNDINNPKEESKNQNDDFTDKKNIFENMLEFDSKNEDEYNKLKNKITFENEYLLINEVYSPIEDEEYFIPNYYDPFPLIRTHLNNSFNPKNRLYFRNILQISNMESISESKIARIRVDSVTPRSINRAQSHKKMMLHLKKSQTIFGYSTQINKFVTILDYVYKNKKRQFFLIKGPLGIGKSLFVRKCLNNFIGLNDFLSINYFWDEQFLFCNLVKPLNNIMPFNTLNYIFREIFLNIKKANKIKDLYINTLPLKLTYEDLKNISFILSIGKNDINLEDEFSEFKKEVIIEKEENTEDNNYYEPKKDNKISEEKSKEKSFIRDLEGPFDFKDKYKLYDFFLQMISVYKNYLNKKNRDNIIIRLNKKDRENKEINKLPLILIIDDLQYSDIYSIEFIQYLFNNEKRELNPFIVILVEQTPINKKFPSLINKNLEHFLFFLCEESIIPKEDKIIKFTMDSLMEKDELQKLIIFYNKEAVMKKYKTNLESVDMQIIDFILMKTFNGNPLFVLSLFDSLIKSEKFIQKLSGEFIITSELIDDNIIHDWSDLLLPYIYEKISSMVINTVLSFKEIIILKYASIIGNIFDLKTLEKLNPLKHIIKVKDMEKLLMKLNEKYLLELYYPEIENRHNTIKNLTGQITFPLMREIFHQKFLMEHRSILHMETAKILSTSKRNEYFSIENELKIFKRHLLYSEMNLVSEIETKDIKTVQDILQNKKMLNYNNLKLYVVKEIFSKFYSNYTGNIMEGNLEILYNNKWLKISYNIDRQMNIYINFKSTKKDKDEIILTIPIKTIYKNEILPYNTPKMKSNNMLAIYQFMNSEEKDNKKIILFSSEQREEICKLDICINFLRVKVNYEKYIFNSVLFQLPLYKIKWFRKKSSLFYASLEKNGISIGKINSDNWINLKNKISETDGKTFKNTKTLKTSFNIIFQSTFSIFLGKIQDNLSKITEKKNLLKDNTSEISIPNHLTKDIEIYLKQSISNIETDKQKLNNNFFFRKSMSLYNPFQSDFIIYNDLNSSLKPEKEKKFNTENKIKQTYRKKDLKEIKEIYEPIKKIKKKKVKRKMKTSKPQGKNTQKIYENIIEKNNKNKISNKKKKYMISEKSTSNTEIIKKEGEENFLVNEFNLEDDDDAPLNISINNINKTFNILDYLVCKTEPD